MDEAAPEVAALLTPPTNNAIVQLPGRHFPGLVLQGDFLAIVCQQLAALEAAPDAEEIAELRKDFDDLLRYYIRVITDHGYQVPFAYRPDTER